MSSWDVFSNHGHVLLCLARNADARLRDVATDVGITERAAQKIVRDLQDEGMISVTKHGRRNHYRIHRKKSLRHDLEAHCTLGELIKLIIRKHPKPKQKAAPVVTTGSKKTRPDKPESTRSEHTTAPERRQRSLF